MGPDCLPNWILRDCAPLLAGPVTSIVNESIKNGFIPSIWKSANVIPVNKISNPHNIKTDFTPISLTPILCKVLEKLIYNWILDAVLQLLDKFQFGGVKGSYTMQALIKLINDWYLAQHRDESKLNNYVQVIFLDYSKAFDRIDPNILVTKLTNLGSSK